MNKLERNFFLQSDNTILDWAALPKSSQLEPNRAARCIRISLVTMRSSHGES